MVKKINETEKSSDSMFNAGEESVMVLFNDEVNTFDYVIENLIEVCHHEPQQAEQCAFITHYKGKCDIKSGSLTTLKLMKDILIERGLSVNIQ